MTPVHLHDGSPCSICGFPLQGQALTDFFNRAVGNNCYFDTKPKLPRATHEAEMKIGNLTMKVFVLDDGRQMIDEESLIAFLEWLGQDETITEEVQKQIDEFAKFVKG